MAERKTQMLAARCSSHPPAGPAATHGGSAQNGSLSGQRSRPACQPYPEKNGCGSTRVAGPAAFDRGGRGGHRSRAVSPGMRGASCSRGPAVPRINPATVTSVSGFISVALSKVARAYLNTEVLRISNGGRQPLRLEP